MTIQRPTGRAADDAALARLDEVLLERLGSVGTKTVAAPEVEPPVEVEPEVERTPEERLAAQAEFVKVLTLPEADLPDVRDPGDRLAEQAELLAQLPSVEPAVEAVAVDDDERLAAQTAALAALQAEPVPPPQDGDPLFPDDEEVPDEDEGKALTADEEKVSVRGGFGKAPKWNPDLHPRDSNGRFATLGSTVSLASGGSGRVVGNRGAGKITVRKDDGSTVDVNSKDTTVTMSAAANAALGSPSVPGQPTRQHPAAAEKPSAKKPKPAGEPIQHPDAAAVEGAAKKPAARPKPGKAPNPPSGVATGSDVGPARGGDTVAAGNDDGVDRSNWTGGVAPGGYDGIGNRPDGSPWGYGYPDSDPRSDPSYDHYTTMLDQKLEQGLTEKGDTQTRFDKVDGVSGAYQPERQAAHNAILDEIMASYANVPKDGNAIVMAGPPGAGKSTVIKLQGSEFGVESNDKGVPTNFAIVNPDDMKAELIARGLVPDDYGVGGQETASFLHEESSDLAAALLARLQADHSNVILDGTFAGKPDKQVSKVHGLREKGYSVTGVLVDGTVERSLANAERRHRKAPATPGGSYEGRYVPVDLISGNRPANPDAVSVVFGRPHRNRSSENIERVQAAFDGGVLWYDNATGAATKVHSTVPTGAEAASRRVDVLATRIAAVTSPEIAAMLQGELDALRATLAQGKGLADLATLEAKALDQLVDEGYDLEETKGGGHDRNRGDAERLRHYWVHGEGAAQIRWGEDGDHMRCVDLLVEHAHFREEQAHGYCFTGDTEFLTRDGVTTFAEAAGETRLVLTAPAPVGPLSRSVHANGRWVEAPIVSFGEQRVLTVTLRRNGARQIIRATPEHLWFTTGPGTAQRRSAVAATPTADLKAGDRLATLLPTPQMQRHVPSPFGVAAGFVFGDGTRDAGGGCRADLWGEKDANLLPYFAGCPSAPVKTAAGVLGTRVSGMPSAWKDAPGLDQGAAYLYGWLAGYIAADGTVTESGGVRIDSARRENLVLAATVANRLGIATYGITDYLRVGYGTEATVMHRLAFVRSTIPPELLIVPAHRARLTTTPDPVRWIVESVEDLGEAEEVFCAVVPGTETFALVGNVWVHNCNLREKEATGLYPAQHAHLRGKSLAEVRASLGMPPYDARLERKAVAAPAVPALADPAAADPALPADAPPAAGGDVANENPMPSGAMVALYPPDDVAHALALPDGEDPASLHVTLAFLGDAAALVDRTDALVELVRTFADDSFDIAGEVSGVGRWEAGPDGDAFVALVDCPDLPDVRTDLIDALVEAGFTPSVDHGFSPHITMSRLPAEDPSPIERLGSMPVKFDTLSLAVGGLVWDFPLHADDDPADSAPDAAAAPAEPAPAPAATDQVPAEAGVAG